MLEIKCLNDIKRIAEEQILPNIMIEYFLNDLKVIKQWDDVEHEWTLENFNTDHTNGGYIVFLDGKETLAELEGIGLTGGLTQIIPEDALVYHIEGDKYVRSVVIYNDSYAMICWLKNFDGFDSYVVG